MDERVIACDASDRVCEGQIKMRGWTSPTSHGRFGCDTDLAMTLIERKAT